MNTAIQKLNNNIEPDKLICLWKEAFPHLDIKRYDWSYKANPYGFPNIYALKDTTSDEINGALTVFPRVFHLGGIKFEGGTTGDFVVKKSLRSLSGAIALQKTMLKSENDSKILIAFPNEVSEKIQIRCGFKKIGRMKVYVKPLNVRIIRNKMPAYFSLLSPFINCHLLLNDLNGRKITKRYRINTCRSVDDRFTELHKSVASRFSLIAERDEKFLNWRYLKNPFKIYHIFTLENRYNQILKAYFIYQKKDNNIYVDDFMWDGEIKSLDAICKAFFSFCKKEKYNAIYIYQFCNKEVDTILRKNNFYSKLMGNSVLTYSSQMCKLEKEKIFLTRGDDDF